MPKHVAVQERPKDTLVTVSIRLSEELANRVRNAVFWTPGMSLVTLGERALERELDRMEKLNGGPYRQRESEELKRGPRAR